MDLVSTTQESHHTQTHATKTAQHTQAGREMREGGDGERKDRGRADAHPAAEEKGHHTRKQALLRFYLRLLLISLAPDTEQTQILSEIQLARPVVTSTSTSSNVPRVEFFLAGGYGMAAGCRYGKPQDGDDT